MSIRLELARTPEFPEGSGERGYLLHLPIRPDGLIDEAAHANDRARAIAFRFWPDERDLRGYVIRTARGWAISYALGDDDDQGVFHLETHPLRLGNYLTITETDGPSRPFRISAIEPLR